MVDKGLGTKIVMSIIVESEVVHIFSIFGRNEVTKIL